MLRRFLIRWLCNGVGLWVAARLLPGITYKDSIWVIVIAALIFSLINMLIRPIVIVLSLPAIVVTLGLFTLVINTLMLVLVTKIYPSFDVSSFGAGLLAIMIVWLVNYALNTILQPRQGEFEGA